MLPGNDTIQLAFIGADTPPQEDDSRDAVRCRTRTPEPWERLPVGEPVEPREPTRSAWIPTRSAWKPRRMKSLAPRPPGCGLRTIRCSRNLMCLKLNLRVRRSIRPTPITPPPTQSPIQPVAIDEVAPPPRMAPSVTIPEPVDPERIETASPTQLAADRDSQAQLPADLMAVGSRMQQLADVDAQSETADARAGRSDQLAESENRGVDSTGMMDDGNPQAANGGMIALPSRARVPTVLAAAAPVIIEQAIARVTPRLGDGQPLPEPYRLRALPAQNEVAAALGGSATAASAVEAALAWLAISQEDDGSWDSSRWGGGLELKVAGHDREGAGADADTGITGLAILAFLGNGQTHLEGTYRKNVQRGLEYLLRSQGADGNLAGPARLYAKMYCHGIATLGTERSAGADGRRADSTRCRAGD